MTCVTDIISVDRRRRERERGREREGERELWREEDRECRQEDGEWRKEDCAFGALSVLRCCSVMSDLTGMP